MTAAVPLSRARWFWLAASLLMLGEFLLFDQQTSRHHASLYPRWNDQIQYLTEAYTSYDQAASHGLWAGLKTALTHPAVQGKLHDIAAVPVFWLAGSASRSAALSLNLLVFLAWQAALLFTLARVSGSRALAWMGFGLVLALAWPWSNEAGSAVDFRLDHAAMCLFGISSCAALLTNGFRSTTWSVVFGLTVGLTLIARFLSAAYYGPMFFLILLWVLLSADRWPRLRRLLIAGAVAAVIALPFFWINRNGIIDYYWVGHITGTESAARVPGLDLKQSVQFLLEGLGEGHLGPWFGGIVLIGTFLLGALAVRRPTEPLPARRSSDWFFWGMIFLLIPTLILTLHRQKSVVVLGILVPGCVLLVLGLWHSLIRRIVSQPSRSWSCLGIPAVAALILIAGGAYFAKSQLSTPHTEQFLTDARKINQLADYIYAKTRDRHLLNPSVGIDHIADYLDGRILKLICYERHGVWINFTNNLPDSILAGPDDIVFFKLQNCDFVILTDEMPGHGHWPYDQQMRRLYPEIKDWCNEHLVLVETFSAFGCVMSFYHREELL